MNKNFYITSDEGKGPERMHPGFMSYQDAINNLQHLFDLASCKVGIDSIEQTDDSLTVCCNGRVLIYTINRRYTIIPAKVFMQNITQN